MRKVTPLLLGDHQGVPSLLIEALNKRFREITSAAEDAPAPAAAATTTSTTTVDAIGDVVTIDDVPVTY